MCSHAGGQRMKWVEEAKGISEQVWGNIEANDKDDSFIVHGRTGDYGIDRSQVEAMNGVQMIEAMKRTQADCGRGVIIAKGLAQRRACSGTE